MLTQNLKLSIAAGTFLRVSVSGCEVEMHIDVPSEDGELLIQALQQKANAQCHDWSLTWTDDTCVIADSKTGASLTMLK